MTSIESQLIDAINADAGQGDRVAEYVYAAHLDEIGDPRGEAWRVLLGTGKRPDHRQQLCNGFYSEAYFWWYKLNPGYGVQSYQLHDLIREQFPMFQSEYPTFFAAMNAAAVAWVRCHRDPEMERVR